MSPKRPPDVTVVIPTRDRPDLLERALATVRAQDGVTVEILVIDDGSQPPVAPADASGVRLVRNDSSRGVAAARNRGIFEASAPWVAFLDDDDLWAPDKLREQLTAMNAAGARWSHTGVHVLTEDLRLRWTNAPAEALVTPDALRQSNTVGTPSGVVADAELLRTVGGFDASYSMFADWDLWLRLLDLAPGIGVSAPLLGYVTHAGSMHRGRMRQTVAEMRTIERCHGHRGPVGGQAMWFWIANSRRDSGQWLSAAALHLGCAARYRSARSLRGSAGALLDAVKPRVERELGSFPLPAWATGRPALGSAEPAA